MSRKDELLPCPFVGEAQSFHHVDRGYGASYHVECQAEDCGNGTCHHDTKAQAFAAWNTRHTATADALEAMREAAHSLAELHAISPFAWPGADLSKTALTRLTAAIAKIEGDTK